MSSENLDKHQWPTITLCGRDWTVIPQRQARLTAGLAGIVQAAAASADGLTAATMVRFATGRMFEVLCTLIPSLDELPEWKFAGFKSEEAFKAGEYDKDADNVSPSVPELLDAFKTAIVVNRLDVVVGAILDPKVVRAVKAEVNAVILDSISSSFQNSPLASGAFPWTTSSPALPTDTGSEASHSPDSTA